MTSSGSLPRAARYVALVILAGALLFSLFVRWRLRDFPLERDEGGYGYIGQLLLDGSPPYQAAYDEKLPGLFLAYAAMMAVFGQTAAGIHLGLLAVNLATIVLIFFLVKDLFDVFGGGIAAASYALLSLSPSMLGTAAHATHFVALFGVAATWALWRALPGDKLWLLLASGFLFGTAFLMKQHGAFLCVFGALVVLSHYICRRPFCWRKLLSGTAVFALGGLLPYAATCVWLWIVGAFGQFWFWTVVYAWNFAQQVPFSRGVYILWHGSLVIGAANWPLELAALLGALLVGWANGAGNVRRLLFAYLAFSFLSICVGCYFRPHYFILLLPAVAIFGGAAGSWMVNVARWPVTDAELRWGWRRPLLWPAVGLLLAATAVVVYQQRQFFFVWTPAQACRHQYKWEPFVESPAVADYLSRHSTPDETVAVLGSEPQLYFYARRRAATGHIFTYPFVERHPFAREMQQQMCREIEAARPEFIVFVDIPSSWWMVSPDFDHFLLDWSQRYLKSYYRPVGLVDMVSLERTDYYWDDQLAQADPHGPNRIWIFRRKK